MDKNIDLQYAIDNGIIDLPNIQSIIEMRKRKEYLEKHKYEVWHGSDGKWHTYLPSGGKRVPRKRNTKEELEDVIVAYYRELEDNPTIKEIFTAWNDYQLSNGFIKANTACRNEAFFGRHFEDFGNVKIKDASLDDWVEFLEAQIPKYNLSAKGFAGLKTVSKGILKRAKRKGYIDFSAKDVIDELIVSKNGFSRKKRNDSEEVYTEDEMALILNACKEKCDVWSKCITLIFVTGLRVGEAVALRHDDLNPKKMSIHVHATESRAKDDEGVIRTFVQETTKTEAGDRIVYLPKQYQYLLTSLWWESSSTEFVFEFKGRRVHTNAIRKKLKRICTEVGIPYKPPHKIRKTFCSILFGNDVDSSFITSQMGHTDISVSEIFYHKNRNTDAENVEVLSAISEFVN